MRSVTARQIRQVDGVRAEVTRLPVECSDMAAGDAEHVTLPQDLHPHMRGYFVGCPPIPRADRLALQQPGKFTISTEHPIRCSQSPAITEQPARRNSRDVRWWFRPVMRPTLRLCPQIRNIMLE